MKSKTDQNRWQNLFYMFVGMAKGNFSYKIKRTRNDDELEALVALSNMLSEELRETFNHHGFLDPRRTYLYLAKMDLYLDSEFKIISFNSEVPELLKLPVGELIKTPIKDILDQQSADIFEQNTGRFKQSNFKRFSLELTFTTHQDLIIHTNCYISSLVHSSGQSYYAVSSFLPVILEENIPNFNPSASKEESGASQIFSNKTDLRRVHQVRDFIVTNLGKELPNAMDLAHKFYTNESKLKKDFRIVFGMTPFQFIKSERLQLARQLIRDTPLSLQNIASTCGFKTYPHFSNAFKDEFKISPQEMRISLGNK
jgi:AraC-like DNA-binding protein